MPSEAQYILLGVVAREAHDHFNVHRAKNGEALGRAIVLAQTMLWPWAVAFVDEHLNQDAWETEDLLQQAGAKVIARFESVTAVTGKEFYALLKVVVEGLVRDQERRRFARRQHRPCEIVSLERDAEAARLAALLVDEQPTGEDLAVLRENKRQVRRVLKRLTREERFAARMIVEGIALARIIELYGVRMRAAWRRARVRLRQGLDS